MAVRVITDTASRIPAELRKRYGIVEVPIYVLQDDAAVPESEIPLQEFYTRIAAGGELPRTSQPSPQDFRTAFSDAVADSSQVIAVLISGGMSGTVQSAENGARLVRESVPGAGITVVDSRSNSMQEGFAVLAAAEVAQAGGSLAECEAAALASIRRSRFLFTPHSLEYLRRGGRISAAGALLGSMLRIAPVLTAEGGEAAVVGKARTQTRAMDVITGLMRRDIERCGLKRIAVQAIADMGRAEEFRRTHIEPLADIEVPLIPIGPSVGLHVGPAVGVVYETVEPLR